MTPIAATAWASLGLSFGLVCLACSKPSDAFGFPKGVAGKTASDAKTKVDDSWTAVVEADEEFRREIHIAPTTAVHVLQSYRASRNARWFVIREGPCTDEPMRGLREDCDYCYAVEYHTNALQTGNGADVPLAAWLRIGGYRFHPLSFVGGRSTFSFLKPGENTDEYPEILDTLLLDTRRALHALFDFEGNTGPTLARTRAFLAGAVDQLFEGDRVATRDLLAELALDEPDVWQPGSKPHQPCCQAQRRATLLLPSVLLEAILVSFYVPSLFPSALLGSGSGNVMITAASDLTRLRSDCAEALASSDPRMECHQEVRYPLSCDGFFVEAR